MNAEPEVTPERLEKVWRERAVRLARRPQTGKNEADDQHIMVFRTGAEQQYGIEMRDVAEVLPPLPVTPVPGASLFFAGVINVRGEIRPVADLHRLLGLPPAPPDRPVCVILVRKEGVELGLAVTRVEHIRTVATSDLQAAAEGQPELSTRYLRGLRGDNLLLLRVDSLLAEFTKETTA